MVLASLFQFLFCRQIARRGGRPHTRLGRRLVIELLEDRTVPAVSILNNGGYAALSFNDSGGYVPPDTCGAAGPSVYVETVNQELAIYNPKSTGASATTDSLSHFFFSTGKLSHADSGSSLSDPIVAYDELIGRFVVGDQDVNFNTHVSAFDLAVSKTDSPTTLSSDWVFYKINTTEKTPLDSYDADYPGNFGYNADAFVVTLNMFGQITAGHTLVVSVNASDLKNAVTSPQVFENDLSDFSVRPTTMHGSVAGDPMWLVTEHGDNQSIDVIKMTSVLTTSANFKYYNVPVTPYSQVVYPKNPNGTIITNNIDSRIMKAAESNNTIVATHAVSVSSTQDVAQWYAFDVSSGTPTLSQQGRIDAGLKTYIVYPGIDINSSGQIGMSYMKSGTDTTTDYLSMWVTGRASTDASGSMQTPVIVPNGTGLTNYSDPYSRAGDLSGINVDPVDGSFWAANEFANKQALANWGTAIANFAPAGPPSKADLAVTKTGPSSVTAGDNATYTITLTNNGPDAAQTVVLSDVLPAGATYVSMTGATGNPDSFTFAQNGSTITGTATTVGSGNTDTFTLVVSTKTNLLDGSDFSDTASVTTSSTDTNSSNNSQTVTGKIVNNIPPADLAVTNTGPTTTVNEGDNVTYTVTVTNTSGNNASNVVLTNTLGANLQFVSATASPGTYTQANGVLTFSFGDIAAGGSATATITAQATEDGTLTNSASVTSDTPDPSSANNSASANTTVTEPTINVSASITTNSRNLTNFVVATFTHGNGVEPANAFTATINWGDGKTSNGTITESGTTYTVTGSHSYRRGAHTITTKVTEVGNDSQLLLAKMGDEVPELPPQLRGHGTNGRSDLHKPSDSDSALVGALIRQNGANAPTLVVTGGNGATGNLNSPNVTASANTLVPGSKTTSSGSNGTVSSGGHGPSFHSALDAVFALDDSSLPDPF
jgi:uncharacterized repeat protein (TIGR01451 family)